MSNEEQTAALRWQSELDQLLEGLRQGNAETALLARMVLALIARDASTETLTDLYEALYDQGEARMEVREAE